MRTELPAYEGGTDRGRLPDGAGLSDDLTHAAPADACFIRIVDETDPEAFEAYILKLEETGFICTWRRDEPSGLYRELSKDGALVYAYYIFAEKRARIIEDNAGMPLAAFASGCPEAPPGGEILTQYGLYYDEMRPGVTCDCGMFYAIRLANGEFIVVDGGEYEQATDAACADCMKTLRAQAGSDTVTVALWFCTHPHNDHMEFFLKMMRVYADTLRVERAAFNFPSPALLRMEPYISLMKRRLGEFAPEANYLKLHAGQRFTLCGVTFDVLLTHEDVLHPEGERRYSGVNETSAVVKLTAPDFSLTLLADIPEENGDVLLARYARGEADCTFLQAAHHCINRDEALYKNIRARYVLIPEKKEMIDKRMRDRYETILKYHPEEAVLPVNDTTLEVRFSQGEPLFTRLPAPRGPYDGSAI
ncbi:MAG: hypothetical protein IJR51_06385 [Clostridia bacterium]|nr:hypothetical protein [Clostridia bacterium]